MKDAQRMASAQKLKEKGNGRDETRHLKVTEKRSERIKNTIGQDRTGWAESALCVVHSAPRQRRVSQPVVGVVVQQPATIRYTTHTHTAPHAEKHIIPPLPFPLTNYYVPTCLLFSLIRWIIGTKSLKVLWWKIRWLYIGEMYMSNHRQTKQCRAVLHT